MRERIFTENFSKYSTSRRKIFPQNLNSLTLGDLSTSIDAYASLQSVRELVKIRDNRMVLSFGVFGRIVFLKSSSLESSFNRSENPGSSDYELAILTRTRRTAVETARDTLADSRLYNSIGRGESSTMEISIVSLFKYGMKVVQFLATWRLLSWTSLEKTRLSGIIEVWRNHTCVWLHRRAIALSYAANELQAWRKEDFRREERGFGWTIVIVSWI